MEAFRGGADDKYTCSMNTIEFKITRALEPYVALLRSDIDDKMSDSCMRAKMEQMKEKRKNVDKAIKMIDEIKQVPLMNLAISANADDAFDFGEDDAFDSAKMTPLRRFGSLGPARRVSSSITPVAATALFGHADCLELLLSGMFSTAW